MFLLLLFLFLFVFPASPALANSQVIIINQVRGKESCCQPGSLENLKKQIHYHQELNIPAHFLIRYDTLNDPSFIAELKKALDTHNHLINLGILIEITPSLAKDTNVNYQATANTWQEAQHVFTIGYSKENRKKLVNQLFNRFHQTFGFFPETSGSWMIDTPTLNYLQENFQTKAHLITREQWGTDTYHLYGGPPHYPYPASSSWAFIPDYDNPNPVLILRQTVTDPTFNYGDTTSSFTSQPNDYLNGGRDFSYFKHLLDQTLFQQPNTGFALLGLENSQGDKYQQEFKHQLEYINELYQNNQITYPSLDDLVSTWTSSPITTYKNHQTTWVTTPNYRVRLLTKDDQTFITDLRLYHPSLEDPYTNYQAVKQGYWITPYLIDGSLNQKQEPLNRSFWLRFFGPPPPAPSFTKTQSDLKNQTTALAIPKNPIFNQDSITFNDTNIDQFKYQDFNSANHPVNFSKSKQELSLTWNVNGQESHQLQVNCKKDQCTMSFQIDPDTFILAQKLHYPFLFPERKPRVTDPKQSVLYIHNRYAIASRNPVRVIFIPKDKFGLPMIPKEKISFQIYPPGQTDPPVTISNKKDQSSQIIDLTSEKPISTKLTIKMDDQPIKDSQVFLAPNCKQNLKYCLTHPRQAIWYTKAIIHDKIRARFFGEQQ
jgi:hypothetical protein